MPMRPEAFLDHVRERGEYRTRAEAERAARVVLALLGAHLVGTVRAELAARLPETYALILLNPLHAAEPLSPERFVRATAAWIEGATEKTALWDIGRSCPPRPPRQETPSPAKSCSSSRPATTSSSATPGPPDHHAPKAGSSTQKGQPQPCTTSLERTRPRQP